MNSGYYSRGRLESVISPYRLSSRPPPNVEYMSTLPAMVPPLAGSQIFIDTDSARHPFPQRKVRNNQCQVSDFWHQPPPSFSGYGILPKRFRICRRRTQQSHAQNNLGLHRRKKETAQFGKSFPWRGPEETLHFHAFLRRAVPACRRLRATRATRVTRKPA